MRKIIHIDMDAFYASVEQRDHPELRDKAIAVGYGEARGVVSTASYEARRFGVHSAMPSLTARKMCPQLIFVQPRFEVYHEVSMQIREIFLEYTDLVEPLSLDEAFLDVTVNRKNNPSASLIAQEIQQRIFGKTHLTASAGVSVNKFLAKIASDYKKPNGLFVIPPDRIEPFVESLNIEQFFGVGKVTAQKMHAHRIFTGHDLKQRTESELVELFGKAGHDFYLRARGIDHREVTPNRAVKSVSSETTFQQDKDNRMLLTVELYHLAREVFERIQTEQFFGRTITVKIKYADFKTITRSRTLPHRITAFQEYWPAARELMKLIDLSGPPVRLIGFGISHAEDEPPPEVSQLELF
ncbi:MAG: DNA polymerase IV [Tannerella sp.]|jgi:DNA polymerase-4|nr:DNA polymerase IV [Tannerella sp.]